MKNTKEKSLAIRFLYGTRIGRLLLKPLIRPSFSKLMYRYLNSPLSKWLAEDYIKKYDIRTDMFEQQEYASFNSFFTRKKKNLSADMTPNRIISPCDGYLSAYRISQELVLKVKNTRYSIESLLRDKELAERYYGGLCLVFRLAPYNYHRYIHIADGSVIKSKKINGVLHCVRPIACEKYPVYTENCREYSVVKTDDLGVIVQMEIGALLVGRINNDNSSEYVLKGFEKGYFEAGGSTVILLFERNRASVFENIRKASAFGRETEVRIGQQIGFIK